MRKAVSLRKRLRGPVAGTLLLLFGLFGAAPARAENAGLQISAAVDLAGGFGFSQGSGGPSQFDVVREAELSLYAPTDYLFDGLLSLAAHNEGGQVVFELHEAALSTTKLLPGSRLKIGQFFLGIGRLNQTHRHDWAFISPPRVQSRLFADEGVLDAGLEYGTLLPLPFYLDLTAGITMGRTFGHSHSNGLVPRVPTHYLRLVTFADFGPGSGLQFGLNYVGRIANDGTRNMYFGLDSVYKSRENQRLTWLVESEIWFRERKLGSSKTRDFGGYLFPQYGLSAAWYVGVRGDLFAELDNKILIHNVVPQITYRPSEFTTLRAAYNIEGTRQSGRLTSTRNFAEVQAVFILGAHPAHTF